MAGIEDEKVSLATLKGGAVIEIFDTELQRVLNNIADVNTDAKAKREVTLKVAIKPTEDRESGAVSIAVVSKLAPFREVGSVLYFGVDEEGNGIAQEFNAKQPALFASHVGGNE